jgi:signal transduction histidine kinase
VTVNGTPRELGSEARLAVYRTAQEALTNVLRHSAADRVEIVLDYEDDGTRLVVRDYGPGAPVAVGPGRAGGPGTGYGLTGMRERAELLGGRLNAQPTADGFRVELWLPR